MLETVAALMATLAKVWELFVGIFAILGGWFAWRAWWDPYKTTKVRTKLVRMRMVPLIDSILAAVRTTVELARACDDPLTPQLRDYRRAHLAHTKPPSALAEFRGLILDASLFGDTGLLAGEFETALLRMYALFPDRATPENVTEGAAAAVKAGERLLRALAQPL